MSTPRLEIRLDHLAHNTRTLVGRLRARGIEVCAVTKAILGCPAIAQVLLDAGATMLGESRIENVESLRRAGITAEIMLVRSPMLSQVERVVTHADVSLNSEISVIEALSGAAVQLGIRHGVVLMVELGDLREGILPDDLAAVARLVVGLPGVEVVGVGANLACQNGIIPDSTNMEELERLASAVEADCSITLRLVTGGNSANLDWAFAPSASGRAPGINQLRLGESILLGREPTRRAVIDGLSTDAFTFVGEVIESKGKPHTPWGTRGQPAFTSRPGEDLDAPGAPGQGTGHRVLVAAGRQDVDPAGLTPPPGHRLLGASSDHLVLEAPPGSHCRVGSELRFGVDYSALVRAMTSPFVTRSFVTGERCGVSVRREHTDS